MASRLLPAARRLNRRAIVAIALFVLPLLGSTLMPADTSPESAGPPRAHASSLFAGPTRRTVAASSPFVVGAGSGSSHVKQFDGPTAAEQKSFFAFDGFTGGVRVAAGDVNGDGVADLVVGAASTAPHVKVFDGQTGALIHSFFAFPGFSGGIFVAAGDVNGDGIADVIVGPDAGGGPQVKVFDVFMGGSVTHNFFAYPPAFTGGVRVAAGDVNGDGRADIIVGPGPAAGQGPQVKVFSGANQALLADFFAYSPTFTGGVFVGGGDVTNDGYADVVVGPDAGMEPRVMVFNLRTGTTPHSFLAYTPGFTGGVRVAAGDVNGDGFADVIVGPGAGGGPQVEVFNGQTGGLIHNFFAFSGSFTGGVYVGGVLPPPVAQPTPTPTRTATPTATATRTPTRTSTPTGPICTPRPPVTVTVAPSAGNTLQVTVTASGSGNTLQTLRFGEPRLSNNELVDVGGVSGRSGAFVVTLAPGTTSTTFTVRRALAGQSTTVHFTVVDGCGAWPTFVGGGPSAF
jgi:hypothetical protein